MTLNTKTLTALIAAALLTTGALAASATTKTTKAGAPSNNQTQTQTHARSPLTVTFYAGDPLSGGTRLSSTTVQPQPRGTTTTPINPFANPPKGATYVALTSDHGTRILTLKDAQTNTFTDHGGLGGRNGHGRGGHGGQFGGQDGRTDGGNTQDGTGARLPGLRDASSVTFYASDPLSGGKVQSTIKLSGTPTATQQQAITQAVAKAKYAMVVRDGETKIVNLSVQPTINH
ncbi:hypothetical protein [Deinococcus alpinitundrae]|uniref:hypothetical protein n=1 Tax=Deinococcus alpinitundrae TaxID=468913 RepID=UPI0013798A54|nr:hypothetical protein [Deinococcus alpinitundrae]